MARTFDSPPAQDSLDEGGIQDEVRPTKRSLASTLASSHIEAAPFDVDLAYTHVVLSQVGLPRRATNAIEFERRNGNAHLVIRAGRLMMGSNGLVQQPLPYGVKPRLILIYLISEAIKRCRPDIEVGDTLRSFINRIGISDVNGRVYSSFKSQLQRLAVAHFTFGYIRDGQSATVTAEPIEEYRGWVADHGIQASLFPGVIRLTPNFFQSLKGYSVPLDRRGLKLLTDTPLGLDVYTWLCHRLARVDDEVLIPWERLKEQFGEEYCRMDHFRSAFLQALQRAREAYPLSRIEPTGEGLILRRSVRAVPSRRKPKGGG